LDICEVVWAGGKTTHVASKKAPPVKGRIIKSRRDVMNRSSARVSKTQRSKKGKMKTVYRLPYQGTSYLTLDREAGSPETSRKGWGKVGGHSLPSSTSAAEVAGVIAVK